MSTGKPTEKNLYADIDAAWHALRTRYGISPENIILYGQSIGKKHSFFVGMPRMSTNNYVWNSQLNQMHLLIFLPLLLLLVFSLQALYQQSI